MLEFDIILNAADRPITVQGKGLVSAPAARWRWLVSEVSVTIRWFHLYTWPLAGLIDLIGIL